MNDILRIGLYLVSFMVSAYALSGVDFGKFMRKGGELRMQLLLLLLSLGLGYIVAQFLLGLSTNYFM
ncbi:DUF1146 domain-containing protein [Erysipelothrix sp. HDW6C]|uniref:DUF1146 family protein n=1 Tax=Erysipelothrix sp. HDW6C TaxID=2714930 RepID=UPI001407BC25|nr:DUF1146 family protein [Erysipelothrix sp. HDW6C]QIK68940.1 DUF1146 domain-containing protein [Erysipelothrix sp. HDW6C]